MLKQDNKKGKRLKSLSLTAHLVGPDRYVYLLESMDAKWRYSSISAVRLLMCVPAFVFLFACESVAEDRNVRRIILWRHLERKQHVLFV